MTLFAYAIGCVDGLRPPVASRQRNPEGAPKVTPDSAEFRFLATRIIALGVIDTTNERTEG